MNIQVIPTPVMYVARQLGQAILPVSGLMGWWKGETLAAYGYGIDDPINVWPDSSGNGNDLGDEAAPPTFDPSFQPATTQFPCAYFGNTGQVLRTVGNLGLTGNQSLTMFAVVRIDDVLDTLRIMGISNQARGGTVNNWAVLCNNSSNGQMFDSGSEYLANFTQSVGGAYYVVSLRYNSATKLVDLPFRDQGFASNVSNGFTFPLALFPGPFSVGASDYPDSFSGDGFNGMVAEVILYNRALSDAEMGLPDDATLPTSILAYLKSKYGFAWTP